MSALSTMDKLSLTGEKSLFGFRGGKKFQCKQTLVNCSSNEHAHKSSFETEMHSWKR